MLLVKISTPVYVNKMPPYVVLMPPCCVVTLVDDPPTHADQPTGTDPPTTPTTFRAHGATAPSEVCTHSARGAYFFFADTGVYYFLHTVVSPCPLARYSGIGRGFSRRDPPE